jgi:hypothetical protein
MANTQKMLSICTEDHDGKSHEDSDGRWNVTTISHEDYCTLVRLSSNKAFWRSLRRRRGSLNHLFLVCVVGRLAF